ncbi:hypothetical protein DCAR_0417254 [Daucus carota subsp. sativus]|uniref:Biogenesis of lysosome-related organelles complex 1 subunit 7 n=1 Tax=Daucus carota subsp. sativus TaxID=79200 RepID=A0AAF0WZZ7_DAUCS|nr:hypothetical protein DCAR_0417254 [Daucus carota subsp. sativus]
MSDEEEPSVSLDSKSKEEEEDSANNSNAANLEPTSNQPLQSTVASGDNSVSESDLAKGLASIISTVITDFDSRAEETIRSQNQLSFSIDRLTGELDQLLEDAPLPFIMQHAAKISGVRKRVSSLNSVLKSVQRRLDNIDRTLSAGLSHGINLTTQENAGLEQLQL